MKKIYHSAIRGCVLGFGLLVALSSCSDDHFDINSASGTGNNTIWQNIEADPQLSSLASILKRTVNINSEYDTHATITYDKYLDQPISFTLWAPVDGTYNAQKYIDMLDKVDALYAEGKTLEAKRLAVQVANVFAKNHITNYNYETNPGLQKVRLLNGKLVNYDAANGSFNGATIDTEGANVLSSNGIIHKIIGESRFANNLHDFIEYDEERFDSLRSMLKRYETRTFDPDASISGSMDPDGNMVYVDSVYYTNNPVESGAAVSSSNEDSLYVAIMPTNNAWDKAKEVTSSLYNYKQKSQVVNGVKTYPFLYNWNTDSKKFTNTLYGLSHADYVANSLKTGNAKIEPTFDVDSISALNANVALYGGMFMSASLFQNVNKNDSASLVNYAMNADSLICTNGVVLYNKNKGGKNPMFGEEAPIKASNGYVFALNDYASFDPAYSFIKHQEIPAYFTSNILSAEGLVGNGQTLVTLTTANKNPEYEDQQVPNNTYIRFQGAGNSRVPLAVKIALPSVASGHYKVSIEIIPNDMDIFLPEGVKKNPAQFSAVINYDDGSAIKGSPLKNKIFKLSDPKKVERIVLAEDLFIQKSYAGLPSGYSSYPYVEIGMTGVSQKRYTDCISICRILLEPVR